MRPAVLPSAGLMAALTDTGSNPVRNAPAGNEAPFRQALLGVNTHVVFVEARDAVVPFDDRLVQGSSAVTTGLGPRSGGRENYSRRRRTDSVSDRRVRSCDASFRAVHGRRSVTSGGELRSRSNAVPNGRVRMASGGMTGTLRVERWRDREP